MDRYIVSNGVKDIFARQAGQIGLGYAILCAKYVISSDPFAILLEDDVYKRK